MLAGTTRVWFWYATISSSTYPWLVYTGTTARIRTPEGMSDVFYNIRSLSRLYTHSCAFLLCNWLVHATLFWLFWSWRWKFPSHRHQLRWWPSPFYRWSNEIGLRYVFRNFETSAGVMVRPYGSLLSKQTGIKRRSKILELKKLQEQSILTIKHLAVCKVYTAACFSVSGPTSLSTVAWVVHTVIQKVTFTRRQIMT